VSTPEEDKKEVARYRELIVKLIGEMVELDVLMDIYRLLRNRANMRRADEQ